MVKTFMALMASLLLTGAAIPPAVPDLFEPTGWTRINSRVFSKLIPVEDDPNVHADLRVSVDPSGEVYFGVMVPCPGTIWLFILVWDSAENVIAYKPCSFPERNPYNISPESMQHYFRALPTRVEQFLQLRPL